MGAHEPPRDRRADVGVVDRRPRRDRPDAARAADRAPDPLDAEPAGARAGDEGDPAALQARQAADEPGDDGLLQGEPDQSGLLVPADPGAVPDLHRPLLRPARLRGGDPAALPGLEHRVARPDRHHRGHEGRLGPAPDRPLRDQPADLVVPDVAEHAAGAARDAADPPDRLHPVRAQLPVRPDALLADHEPVDDRSGVDHEAADAEAATAAEEELADAAEDRDRGRRRRQRNRRGEEAGRRRRRASAR